MACDANVMSWEAAMSGSTIKSSTTTMITGASSAIAPTLIGLLTLCASGCLEPKPRATPTQQQRALGPAKVGAYLMVDQFGYRPDDPKVAVLVDPQQGFNAKDSYTPGTTLEVRRWADDKVVFSGAPSAWSGGKTQASSGDRGWWFDFSTVKAPGSYYLYDPQQKLGSHRFEIDRDVYRGALIAATRMFFYNRAGAAKKPPHTDPKWQDDAAYLGPGQDGEARAVDDKNNGSKARDLRGGWFDAGDTNKYVTFAESVVHQLLSAYSQNPAPFTDDFNIPESGNGVPDLLDEIKWELDWIKRMQQSDGGVLIKVGVLDHNDVAPPSKDKRPRYYAPKCSSSSIATAGMFAHAALVFGGVAPLAAEVSDLTKRAEQAWSWYQQNPKRSDCDSQEIKAGDADRSQAEQRASAVVAAIYLFALTGNKSYHDHVKANYKQTRPYQDNGWSRYDPHQGDALLFYTTLAQADATIKQAILAKKLTEATSVSEIYGKAALDKDLYRAFITDATYHWGSNNARACNGSTNVDMLVYTLDAPNAAAYRARALGILHYMHGVNPLGMVYLSNMGSYGAEVSASEIYHTWFAHGTDWDSAKTSSKGPAPGYVVGGPNNGYGGPLSPPAGQPPQKSYLDWNAGWPENSWEVTEPGIYYQSAYLKLLSGFVGAPSKPTPTDAGPTGDGAPSDGSAPPRDGGPSGDGSKTGDGPASSADRGVAGAGDASGRSEEGCSCAVDGADHGTLASSLLLIMLLVSLGRRRPARRRRRARRL
jgi:endoglucanase